MPRSTHSRHRKHTYHVKVEFPDIGVHGKSTFFITEARSSAEAKAKIRKTILHRPMRVKKVSRIDSPEARYKAARGEM